MPVGRAIPVGHLAGLTFRFTASAQISLFNYQYQIAILATDSLLNHASLYIRSVDAPRFVNTSPNRQYV
jgi:hypothetical protein